MDEQAFQPENVEVSGDKLHLRQALLIYSADYSRTAPVITSHQVEGRQIMPGVPLDVAAFRRQLDDPELLSEKKREAGRDVTWHFPRLLAEHPAWRIWWSPAGVRPLFVAGKKHQAWVPMLVWMGHRHRRVCYLWAVTTRDSSQLRPETIVYRPKFGPEGGLNHIFDDSAICLGSMNPGRCRPQDWEEAFWDSNFKEPGNLSSTRPYAPEKRFKKLGPLASQIDAVIAKSETGHGQFDDD